MVIIGDNLSKKLSFILNIYQSHKYKLQISDITLSIIGRIYKLQPNDIILNTTNFKNINYK